MTLYSARHNIPRPELTDTPVDFEQLFQDRDAILDLFGWIDSGALSGRPVSTPGAPGQATRLYIVTDQPDSPRLDFDYGTGWITVARSTDVRFPSSDWTDFVPDFSAAGGGNFVLGTSILKGAYYMVGPHLCHIKVSLLVQAGFNGRNGVITMTLPFEASALTDEQELRVKLFTGPGINKSFLGFAYVHIGSNLAYLFMPANSGASNLQGMQNADGTGNPGTGVPQIGGSIGLGDPASYPLAPGANLIVEGEYAI